MPTHRPSFPGAASAAGVVSGAARAGLPRPVIASYSIPARPFGCRPSATTAIGDRGEHEAALVGVLALDERQQREQRAADQRAGHGGDATDDREQQQHDVVQRFELDGSAGGLSPPNSAPATPAMNADATKTASFVRRTSSPSVAHAAWLSRNAASRRPN